MEPTGRWRELLDYRVAEAVAVLGSVPGVRGLIVGGSMGRGDPWPLSDIDVLPVYAVSGDPARQVMQRHAELIDWWAASGRAQTLDVGWLARRLVGEQVTPEQNARDQLLAFATHVVRRRPDLAGPWIGGAPNPVLEEAMAALEAIMATLRRAENLPEA